jgi:hypothetical protein
MSDLSFHIRQFVPDCEGEELEHRTSLLKARDYAAELRARTISNRALEHAADAHEMAGAYLYADVPAARLKIAVAYCRNLVHAAMLADHLADEVGVQ